MADDLAAQFTPDYTPEQLESLGVYDALYRGQGPRLASLGEWKPEWVSEHDPKGWAQWYKRYASGRRIGDEDERQIKRWLSFKARHGGPFAKNPTPRRGWALRNWGIDPAKLVAAEQANSVTEMLDEYKNKAMQKYVQERAKQAELITELQRQEHQPRIADKFITQATLMGSRGRAKMYGRPEPQDRDYDYIAFTDDPKRHTQFRKMFNTLAQKHNYKLKERPGGFLTASGNNTDLSFYPVAKRDDIHKAWALQESGMSKDDAWAKIEAEKQAELIPELQLQEHQQRISDRVAGDEPRMLVYHGLGSGKSLSALAAAEAAKKQFGDNYGIAVPASLRGNFQKEINKFTRGSNPEIMSYTGLALGKQFKEQPDTLIMDEAHRLRNPDAASSRGARAAAQAAKRVLLLTGSPITNSPSDLANLLGMLHNKKITPEEFEKRYIDYKKVNPGIVNWFRGIKPGEQPVVKNEKELRALLKGKVDYQPSKTPEGVDVNEEIVRVPLSPQQQKIQKAIRTKVPPGFLWKLDSEFPLSRDELAKLNSFLTGMRQVSLSTQPFRADKDPAKAFEQSAKLQEAFKRLKETLDSDKRKKAIIYSNFIDSGLAPYAAGLERAGVPHAFFHGGVSPKARQAAVEAYNKGKLRALLIGPAGAEGLSTKGTSLIQLMDPHWHESRSQQARGRGLRFDSHRDLPEELKNVAVQRFISSSEDPSWLGKLMGYSRERTGDEVLEHLTAEKEKLNDVFRKILREEGTEKQSASPWARIAKSLLPASVPVASGAGAGVANNEYLNQVNPDVSTLGRTRSNMRAVTMGAALPFLARGRVAKTGWPGAALIGTGLGLRYGIVTPEDMLGKYTDPGKMALPKLWSWLDKPENMKKVQRGIADPVAVGVDAGHDYFLGKTEEAFITGSPALDQSGKPILDEKGKPKRNAPWLRKAIGKSLREQTMPTLYASILKSLGSDVKYKTVKDLKSGEETKIPDVTAGDVGTAIAPHLVGGVGGGYLGYRLGDTFGNFLFPDKPSEDYERRRRQEDRRWWLQFLGGNLGAVGGTIASIKAMPQLREIIRNTAQQNAATKQAAHPMARIAGAAGQFAKNRAADLGYGAAITAGQYGLNSQVPGFIPASSFDSEGNPLTTTADRAYLSMLTAVNAMASRPWRKATGRIRTLPGKQPGFGSLWGSGTMLTAGPAIVHPFRKVPTAWEGIKVMSPDIKLIPGKETGADNPDNLMNVIFRSMSGLFDETTGTAKSVLDKKYDANKERYTASGLQALSGLAEEAKVPGFDTDGNLKKMLGSAGLATLGQGAGVVSGGVLGMLGGDWLTDKVLSTAVDRGWIKKKKNWHKFLRDLGSLAGAGVGAYGALRAMDYGIPAAQAYYAKRQQAPQQSADQKQPASV